MSETNFFLEAIAILRAVGENARDISREQRQARDLLKRYDLVVDEGLARAEHRQRLVAGWKKCCRCFPNAVNNGGFCGCCLFDHATGERIEMFESGVELPL